MKEYIKELTESLTFPKEATASLLEVYDAVYQNSETASKFNYWIERYNQNYFRKDWTEYDRMLEDMDVVANAINIDNKRVHLLIFILLAPHLKELYTENGYTDEMYHDTMMDLYAKMTEEYEFSKVWGTSVAHWFSGFYNLDRFGFGRLQFELIEFGWESYDDGKGHTLDAISNIVNIHIPALGKLDHEECVKAYKKAADFFSERFKTDCIPFMCSSWLLYKPAHDLLADTSNIKQFMNDFDVFSCAEEKANLWSLFPVFKSEYTDNFEQLTTNTSLKRLYRQRALNGEPVGSGSGVFFFERPNEFPIRWKGKKRMYDFYKDYDPEADKRGEYI